MNGEKKSNQKLELSSAITKSGEKPLCLSAEEKTKDHVRFSNLVNVNYWDRDRSPEIKELYEEHNVDLSFFNSSLGLTPSKDIVPDPSQAKTAGKEKKKKGFARNLLMKNKKKNQQPPTPIPASPTSSDSKTPSSEPGGRTPEELKKMAREKTTSCKWSICYLCVSPKDDFTIDGLEKPNKIESENNLPEQAPRTAHVMISLEHSVNALQAYFPNGINVTLQTIRDEMSFPKGTEIPEDMGPNINIISCHMWFYTYTLSEFFKSPKFSSLSQIQQNTFRHDCSVKLNDIIDIIDHKLAQELAKYLESNMIFKLHIIKAYIGLSNDKNINYQDEPLERHFTEEWLQPEGFRLSKVEDLKENFIIKPKVAKRTSTSHESLIESQQLKDIEKHPFIEKPRSRSLLEKVATRIGGKSETNFSSGEFIEVGRLPVSTQLKLLSESWPAVILEELEKLSRFINYLVEDLKNEKFRAKEHKCSELLRNMRNCNKFLLERDVHLRDDDKKDVKEWITYTLTHLDYFLTENDLLVRKILEVLEIFDICAHHLNTHKEINGLGLKEIKIDFSIFFHRIPNRIRRILLDAHKLTISKWAKEDEEKLAQIKKECEESQTPFNPNEYLTKFQRARLGSASWLQKAVKIALKANSPSREKANISGRDDFYNADYPFLLNANTINMGPTLVKITIESRYKAKPSISGFVKDKDKDPTSN